MLNLTATIGRWSRQTLIANEAENYENNHRQCFGYHGHIFLELPAGILLSKSFVLVFTNRLATGREVTHKIH